MARWRLILLASAVGAAAILAVLPRHEYSPVRRGPAPATPRDVPEGQDEAGTADLIVEVSGIDGMPVEGASVRGETQDHTDVEALTGAHGRAPMRHDTWVGSLVVRKCGFLRSLTSEQGGDGIVRFVLTPAPPVDGRVVFVDGAPAPGCAIRAWNPDPFPFGEDLDATATDAEGRFRIAGVPLCQPFLVEASLAGYGPVTVRQLPVEVPAPVLITLGGGAVIEGVVLGPEGSPRAGAQVAIVPDGVPSPFLKRREHDVASTLTDAAGRFRVVGVSAPAAHVVYAQDGPLVARAGPLAVAPGQSVRADLRLQQTGGLRVRLLKPDGSPTTYARVEILLRPASIGLFKERRDLHLPKVGDAFEVDGLPPLPHEISVKPSSGFMPSFRTVPIVPGRTVDVECVLEPGRTIEGRVVGVGGPLPASTVVTLSWSLPRPYGYPGYDHIYPDGIGEDGLFELSVPSRAEIDLTISAAGYLPWERRIGPEETGIEAALERAPHVRFHVADAPASLHVDGLWDYFKPDTEGNFLVPAPGAGRPFDVSFGQSYVLDKLVLGRGETRDLGLISPVARGVLSGQVVGPDGKPVPGALVETTDLWSGMDSQRTDRSGAFRFEDHLLARTTLRVCADGFPDLWTIVDPRGHVTVELVRGAEVGGRVIDSDGEPFPGAQLRFLEVLVDGSFDEDRPHEPDVDSLGRFRLLLPAGMFQSVAGIHGGGDRVPGPAFRVAEGETREIVIQLPWSLKLWH